MEPIMKEQELYIKNEENFDEIKIRKEIWLHPELDCRDKIIYAIIDEEGVCTRQALLSYCKEILHISNPLAIKSYSKLIKLNLIINLKSKIGELSKFAVWGYNE